MENMRMRVHWIRWGWEDENEYEDTRVSKKDDRMKIRRSRWGWDNERIKIRIRMRGWGWVDDE